VTLDLQLFRYGWFTIEAVQPMPVTGLTIFEPIGRRKANFGDWVYKTPGGAFLTRDDAMFRELFPSTEEVR
jgi:hypothetical protein